MSPVSITDENASPVVPPVYRALAVRNATARQVASRLIDPESASQRASTELTLVRRLRMFLEYLSRAMTGAYAITPSFGRVQIPAQCPHPEQMTDAVDEGGDDEPWAVAA